MFLVFNLVKKRYEFFIQICLVKAHPQTPLFLLHHQFQVEGTNGSTSSTSLTRNSDDANPAYLTFAKTRGTSDGSNTIVQDGDSLGTISFNGADGTNKDHMAAQITGAIDGTPGENDLPGRLIFKTTADGANSSTERMRIDSSGRVAIGSTSFGDTYEYLRVQAASGAGNPSNVSIIGGNTSHSTLNLGDTDDFNIQRIKSDHSNNSLLFYNDNGLTLTLDSSHNATFAGTVSDSKGNLRDIPVNGQSSQVTLATSDIGKVVATTSGGWVIPNSTFSNGNTITLLI